MAVRAGVRVLVWGWAVLVVGGLGGTWWLGGGVAPTDGAGPERSAPPSPTPVRLPEACPEPSPTPARTFADGAKGTSDGEFRAEARADVRAEVRDCLVITTG
ncbi:hypothetical protein GTW43_37470 [Streptomyces sp. SID5785]|uniref:hypothetical protein n=1 Tax=Streptomyces sp. SID5785 TaxID=2690309 RepID=UPI0013618616|nr:hypothetical protein [Streptomyces sp. SID5785]MZD10726.1 hypothetical protein [Streptomyces sp. SID5785]